jgi:hypothetical protein
MIDLNFIIIFTVKLIIYYKFFTFKARKELITANTVTPTSANIAAHMVANPTALNISTRTLIPIAKTIFC